MCKASTGVHSWPRGERSVPNWIYYRMECVVSMDCVVSTTVKEKVVCSKSPNEEKFNSHMRLGGWMIS